MPGSILGTRGPPGRGPRAPARSGHLRRQPRQRRRRPRGLRAQPVRPRPDHRRSTPRPRPRPPGVLARATPADDLGRDAAAELRRRQRARRRGRRSPSTRCATSATRSPSSSPRPGPRRSTPPSWSTSTTTTCRSSSTWRTPRPTTLRCSSRRSAATSPTPRRGHATPPTSSTTPTLVTRVRMENQRIADRADRGQRDPGRGRPTTGIEACVSTQHPHLARDLLAKAIGVDAGAGPGGGAPRRRRVRRQGRHRSRPRRDRVAAAQARPAGDVDRDPQRGDALDARPGQVQYAELGLTRDGTITGLRLRMLGDCGAYAGFGGALAVGPTYIMAPGPLRHPAAALRRHRAR